MADNDEEEGNVASKPLMTPLTVDHYRLLYVHKDEKIRVLTSKVQEQETTIQRLQKELSALRQKHGEAADSSVVPTNGAVNPANGQAEGASNETNGKAAAASPSIDKTEKAAGSPAEESATAPHQHTTNAMPAATTTASTESNLNQSPAESPEKETDSTRELLIKNGWIAAPGASSANTGRLKKKKKRPPPPTSSSEESDEEELEDSEEVPPPPKKSNRENQHEKKRPPPPPSLSDEEEESAPPPKKPNREKQHENLKKGWDLRRGYWEERFAELVTYKEQNGHTNVPHKYPDNPALGHWVITQRQYYRNTMNLPPEIAPDRKLCAEKIFKLQKLGFQWEVQKAQNAATWEDRYRELIRFKSDHGHCRVPKRYPPNMKLGNWVYEQRKNYKSILTGTGRGRRGMTDERIRRLEELGFQWSAKS
ncbi:helicase [Seminavis robusta]|uniref:Helicase n=1 Tax=Seminavis robusta TaxID=568900 RepID=A0A9N8EW61_9STRA|nr:helicase [Seminavis robusta]|eukprot:Sro1733_g294260.1 helicase (423) ;mRNA; f:9884-11152